VYTFRKELTIASNITILQAAAGTAAPFIILSARLTQRGTTASVQEKVAIVRKTAAATVTTATVGTDLFKNRVGDPAPGLQLGTALSGWQATAEGTDGDTIIQDGFNVLNGWNLPSLPEERLHVQGGQIIAMKFPTTPTTQLWEIYLSLQELGG
jgi:hypothetical protein